MEYPIIDMQSPSWSSKQFFGGGDHSRHVSGESRASLSSSSTSKRVSIRAGNEADVTLALCQCRNVDEYKEALEALNIKIDELQEAAACNKPFKSKRVAYVVTAIFCPASFGVLFYKMLVDIGLSSSNHSLHVASVVMTVAMVVLSGIMLIAFHLLVRDTHNQRKLFLELYQNQHYRRFISTQIAYSANPHPATLKNMMELYEKLPEQKQKLHQEMT